MLPSATFPLPIVWRTDLPWFFLALHLPFADAQQVSARCGANVVRMDSQSGAILWQTEVDPDSGNGAMFLQQGTGYITEQARNPPDLLGTIVALSNEGEIRWRCDLPTMLALDSGIIDGGRLYALSLGQDTTTLYIVDAENGAQVAQRPLPWPADAMVALPQGLVARNRRTAAGAPGLAVYPIDHQGRPTADPSPLLDREVVQLAHRGESLLAVSHDPATDTHGIHVYAADTMSERWHASTRTPAAAMDQARVFHVAPRGAHGAQSNPTAGSQPRPQPRPQPDAEAEHGTLVARDIHSGDRIWHSEPLTAPILSISVAGPVIFCNHRKGQALYRSDDGHFIGEVRGSYGPAAVVGEHLYLARPRAFLCASLKPIL